MAKGKPPEWSDRLWSAYNEHGEADSEKVEVGIRFLEAMIKLEGKVYKKHDPEVVDHENTYRGDIDFCMSPRDELISLMSDFYRIMKPYVVDGQGERLEVRDALRESYNAWYMKTCELPKHRDSHWPDAPQWYRGFTPYLFNACAKCIEEYLRRDYADAPMVELERKGILSLVEKPVRKKDTSKISDELPAFDIYVGDKTDDILVTINQDIKKYLESGKWREDLGTEQVEIKTKRKYNEKRKDFITRVYKDVEVQVIKAMQLESQKGRRRIDPRGRPVDPSLKAEEMLVRRWFGEGVTDISLSSHCGDALLTKQGYRIADPHRTIRERSDRIARILGFLPPHKSMDSRKSMD